jgi:hypothetical protein
VLVERWLEASVGGYLDVAIRLILRREDIGAAVRYTGDPPPPEGLPVRCEWRDGEILLTKAQGHGQWPKQAGTLNRALVR